MSRRPKIGNYEYRGVLAEPLPQLTPFSTRTERSEFSKLLDEKMLHLRQHFNVDPADPDAYRRLSIALAIRHVPGFGPPRKPGRPREREDDALIVSLFIMIMLRNGVSERDASKLIEKAGFIRGKAETLRKRYRAPAMRLWIDLLQRVVDSIGKEKTIAVLAKTVDDLLPPTGAKSDSI